MSKYIKRIPDTYEAFQYDGDFKHSNGVYYVPLWAIEALDEGVLRYDNDKPWELNIRYPSRDDWERVHVGDYILNDNGFLCVISKEFFESNFILLGKGAEE